MTNEEKLQREQKCSHFATSLLRLHKINRNSKIAFIYTCLFAFINAFTAIITTATSGVIVGLAQVFMSLLLTGLAFWVWTKSYIPKYILAIFLLFQVIGIFSNVGAINPFLSLIGLVLTIITIVDLREYKKLEKLNGFPHFNERFELQDNEYSPTYKTVSRVNDGRMDAMGYKQANNERMNVTENEQVTAIKQPITMIDKKMPEIVIEKLPQVDDMYFPKKPVIDKLVSSIKTELVSTLENVKEQARVNTSKPNYTLNNVAEQNKLNTDTSKLFPKLDTKDSVTPVKSEISITREPSISNKPSSISEKPVATKLPSPMEKPVATKIDNATEKPVVAVTSKKPEPAKENNEDVVEAFKSKYSNYFSQYDTIYDGKNKTL